MGRQEWRARVWVGMFSALGLASALGAVVHGLPVSQRVHNALWKLLYLSLGVVVALFVTTATTDGWGERAGRRALPFMLLTALGFYGASQRLAHGFLVFIVYEAVALLYALAVYTQLARGGRLTGAHLIATGILLSIIAAAVQATDMQADILGLPFDHNGLFHLVQIAGLPVLAAGIETSLNP